MGKALPAESEAITLRDILPRLTTPLVVAVAVVAIGPLIRPLRDLVFSVFTGRGLMVLSGVLVVALGLPIVVGLARIRERRMLRYLGLVVVGFAIWLQMSGIHQQLPGSIRAQVALVEQVHILLYGGLAAILVHALRPLGLVQASTLSLVMATVVGIVDESVQYVVPSRTGEVRDIVINAVAAATGVLFGICLWTPAWRGARGLLRPLARGLAILTLAFGAFVSVAHLGYLIVDPEVGSFRSWSSAESLRAKARDRAIRWRTKAPTGQELCCVQDYFLTEASRHNEHRMERFRAGDAVAAWHANNILEKYYAPYLDKPLPPNGRLPRNEIDSEILARAGAERDPAGYRSPVLAQRIWTRPGKPVWNGTTLALTLMLWWLSHLGSVTD